ncbi:MAG: 30S ribosomal protein S3 [Nanoarchaeota archaeon]|nr:30S ribosomal protein S3 [Nanoarchaeota archaeon]
MIERDFINQKTKEYYIKKFVKEKLNNVGISNIKLKKIPLGEKIIVFTNKPSLVVGSKGGNIKDLTRALKTEFKLENPQIEIGEVKDMFLDAQLVAEKVASSLERFGSARFKGVGHKIMTNVMNSGAYGVEIIISGKIPSARAKSWRFYMGYLKKCGDISVSGVRRAQASALLKSGIIGIKVAIMPPDVVLPDRIEVLSEAVQVVEAVPQKEDTPDDSSKKKKTGEKKKAPRKKAVKKDVAVKDESVKNEQENIKPAETSTVADTTNEEVSESSAEVVA